MIDDEKRPDDLADATAWTDSLAVRPSVIHGLGVFARRRFETGEIIERVPCVPIPEDEMHFARLRGTIMHRYPMPDVPEPGRSAWMLGYGALYNHTPPGSQSNAHWQQVGERLLVFVAREAIEPGDEITYDYGEDTGF